MLAPLRSTLGEKSWVVLAEPEGNEVGVLQSPDDLARWQAAQQTHG